MATHSSILAWKIPWTGEPCRLQSMGLQRVRHDSATSLMKMKEESEKAGLKRNVQKKKKNEDHGIRSHHFIANRWGRQWISKSFFTSGTTSSQRAHDVNFVYAVSLVHWASHKTCPCSLFLDKRSPFPLHWGTEDTHQKPLGHPCSSPSQNVSSPPSDPACNVSQQERLLSRDTASASAASGGVAISESLPSEPRADPRFLSSALLTRPSNRSLFLLNTLHCLQGKNYLVIRYTLLCWSSTQKLSAI